MLTVFLPCRKGSQRITDKNIRPFADVEDGLLSIKLRQLQSSKLVDEVVLSSNDERILDFGVKSGYSKLRLDERPEHLGANDTSTDDVIKYVPSVIAEGDIMWTHVTSPFIDEKDYDEYISTFEKKRREGYDSLMTVKKIQTFLWNENGPTNYTRSTEKWPRTQTIDPIYEVDSGAFIASRDCYLTNGDRVGKNTFLYTQESIKSLDIDWPDDFELAQYVWQALQNK